MVRSKYPAVQQPHDIFWLFLTLDIVRGTLTQSYCSFFTYTWFNLLECVYIP